MNDSEIKVEQEIIVGREFQDTWNRMVEPFFNNKQAELYEAFLTTSVDNEKGLVLIKMQSLVLEGLKSNFIHFINTGKLAEKQRNKE